MKTFWVWSIQQIRKFHGVNSSDKDERDKREALLKRKHTVYQKLNRGIKSFRGGLMEDRLMSSNSDETFIGKPSLEGVGSGGTPGERLLTSRMHAVELQTWIRVNRWVMTRLVWLSQEEKKSLRERERDAWLCGSLRTSI